MADSWSQCVPIWWAVLGDALLDEGEIVWREVSSDATSHIVQAQKRADLKQYWIRVPESHGGLHTNLIFPATPKVAERFASGKFQPYIGAGGLQRIGPTRTDLKTVVSYLVGERTPQAEFVVGRQFGPRVPGSHRLGEGGGDRVQLSPALREELIERGLIEPWQRTTSKNIRGSERRPQRPEPSPEIVIDVPKLVVISSTPLTQLDLFTALPTQPYISPLALRTFREAKGYSQVQIAARLGIRDRSHIANIERGHDRLSPPRARLLRHMIEREACAA